MQLFAKRFWGFDPDLWPIISFHLKGNRDALVRASRPGDRIVFIGTDTEETETPYRGRLIGMAEIGRIEIEAADVLDVAALRPNAFDEHGQLRWPKALPMLRAWRFQIPPLVRDVLQEQLSYEATVRAVLLDAFDTASVLALPHDEVAVRDAKAISRQRALNDVLSASGPTTGPKPSSWSGVVARDATQVSFTYAFQFGNRDLWKIGHASDVAARLRDVNKHVPHEVLGEHWHQALQQRWPTEVEAYKMEQRVLLGLRTSSCVGERVTCTKRKLESTWSSALAPRS
jgi:hypothetical protein